MQAYIYCNHDLNRHRDGDGRFSDVWANEAVHFDQPTYYLPLVVGRPWAPGDKASASEAVGPGIEARPPRPGPAVATGTGTGTLGCGRRVRDRAALTAGGILIGMFLSHAGRAGKDSSFYRWW